MKTLIVAAALIALSGQSPAAPASAGHKLHLVYQFGYNTKVASSGQGTGTTTIDVSGPADDGGLVVTGQDFWWNDVRARAANTCEVYPGGSVSCAAAPWAISPIQLTVFPLLAKAYFKGLAANATQTWTQDFSVKAAILPGAAGMAGQLTTWNFSYALEGKGVVPNGAPLILVTTNGTLEQEGGRSLQAKSKQRIAYDPVNKVPAFVSDVRTHIPMRSVYSNDLVEVKLIKLNRS
ncbi:MAG: hypothetical protein JO175_02995 [Candidatus Eremiobacteraeota bacterium]|nr:hypothetical protein [Candidatus Eremiobacteraeota bacterium]